MRGESSIGSQFWVQVECSLKLTVARFVEAFKWTCCVHHFEVSSEYIYIERESWEELIAGIDEECRGSLETW